MNVLSRTITGGIMILVGLILICVAFFKVVWVLIYGVPIFIIGFFILLNKKEDKIEEIKYEKRSKMKGGKK